METVLNGVRASKAPGPERCTSDRTRSVELHNRLR